VERVPTRFRGSRRELARGILSPLRGEAEASLGGRPSRRLLSKPRPPAMLAWVVGRAGASPEVPHPLKAPTRVPLSRAHREEPACRLPIPHDGRAFWEQEALGAGAAMTSPPCGRFKQQPEGWTPNAALNSGAGIWCPRFGVSEGNQVHSPEADFSPAGEWGNAVFGARRRASALQGGEKCRPSRSHADKPGTARRWRAVLGLAAGRQTARRALPPLAFPVTV
jgi:hypothetical protein